MSKQINTAVLLLFLMVGGVLLSEAIKPKTKIIDLIGKLNLESTIPTHLSNWQVEDTSPTLIISPEQAETLSRIYSQIITRTYINPKGQRIMLSIAYGEDQRDENQMHYPEVCYPAQGFIVKSLQNESIVLSEQTLPIKRLEADFGSERHENITYWTTIGNKVSTQNWKKKYFELSYGLKGYIPDGLLFRVSTIGKNSRDDFELQDGFLIELTNSIDATFKSRIIGNSSNLSNNSLFSYMSNSSTDFNRFNKAQAALSAPLPTFYESLSQ
ncbi:exosortase-associated protein EpsI, B-type [Ampullimonas aquatilis]|uniref:exosortase-associated protein EpsI, B-type n=1 Tax=Ampullimonas aquatilis TaxID=1341549 RepID=UPI003C74B26A